MKNTYKIPALAVALLALIEEPSYAERPIHPILVKLKKCVASSQTTQTTAQCRVDEQKAWDDELNSVYKKLTDAIQDTVAKAALKKSQQTWITLREQEFKFYDAYYGAMEGTLWNSIAAGMKATFVKDRVMELYRTLESTDMSGENSKQYVFDIN